MLNLTTLCRTSKLHALIHVRSHCVSTIKTIGSILIISYSSQCTQDVGAHKFGSLHITNVSRHGENVEVLASYTIPYMLHQSTKPYSSLYDRSHASIRVRAHHIINHPNHCFQKSYSILVSMWDMTFGICDGISRLCTFLP